MKSVRTFMLELNIEKYQFLNKVDTFFVLRKHFIMINIISNQIEFEIELKKKTDWHANRVLAKVSYVVHTDAIKR